MNKHHALAELVGRTAHALHPDLRAVLTILVLPDGAVTIGGALPGVDEHQARQQLAFTLRKALEQLEKAGADGPVIWMPGGRA